MATCQAAARWYATVIGQSDFTWSAAFFAIITSVAAILIAALAYAMAVARGPATVWSAALLTVTILLYIAWACIHYRAVYSQPRNALRQWAADYLRSPGARPLSSLLAEPFWKTLGRDFAALAHSSANAPIGAPPARIHTERLSRKTRSLDTLYEVVAALNDAHNRDDMLATFLDVLTELLDASAAQVFLRQDGQLLEVARLGDPDEIIARFGLSNRIHELNNAVARSGRFAIQKIWEDPKLDAGHQNAPYPVPFDYIVAPVRYRNAILGVYTLILPNAAAALGDDFRDLVTSLGRHLGLALEKARLDDHARRLAVMEERDILRNELHDTLAQYLVSMRLQAKMLGELLYKREWRAAESEAWRLRLAIEEAHSSLRELLSSFRFRMDERGLLPALKELVTRFEQDTRITTILQYKIRHLRLSPTQEVEVYRIVQEALANIRRHSRALTARVLLLEDNDGAYRVIIEDDGVGMAQGDEHTGFSDLGMEEKQGERDGTHIGLAIMRERCKRLGGSLRLESEPGEGTRVILRIPAKTMVNSGAGTAIGQ